MLRKRDVIDRNLIALLQEDARISTSDISRRLGVARSTVSERIARLEQDGVIMGYCAVIRDEEQVQQTRSYVSIKCDPCQRQSIVQHLRSYPEISECVSVSGSYDLMCTVLTPCAEDVDALIDELSGVSGVQSLDTTVVLSGKFNRQAHQQAATVHYLSLAK